MRSFFALTFALTSIACVAQSQPKAEVFRAGQWRGQLQALTTKAKAGGSAGATLGDYVSHTIMISERTANGGAEIHAHFDDIMIVTAGSATLVTGGAVVDAHTGANGETSGTSIKDGQSTQVENGDVIHIPAGTPHQLLIAPGVIYSALVVKIRE